RRQRVLARAAALAGRLGGQSLDREHALRLTLEEWPLAVGARHAAIAAHDGRGLTRRRLVASHLRLVAVVDQVAGGAGAVVAGEPAADVEADHQDPRIDVWSRVPGYSRRPPGP